MKGPCRNCGLPYGDHTSTDFTSTDLPKKSIGRKLRRSADIYRKRLWCPTATIYEEDRRAVLVKRLRDWTRLEDKGLPIIGEEFFCRICGRHIHIHTVDALEICVKATDKEDGR